MSHLFITNMTSKSVFIPQHTCTPRTHWDSRQSIGCSENVATAEETNCNFTTFGIEHQVDFSCTHYVLLGLL